MANREDVIKGLDCHLARMTDSLINGAVHSCRDCPYRAEMNCTTQLIANALELLKDDALIQYNEGYHDGYQLALTGRGAVVHCKDCKWYKEGEHLAPNRFCFRLKDANGKHIGYNFSDNDYCSHGERKDEHATD